jgi:hypothetical protein
MALSTSAQELPEKMKYDSINVSENGLTALVYKGKKSSVYNFDKKEFEIPPTKDAIIYFKNIETYARISKGNISLNMYTKEGTTNFFKRRTGDSTFLAMYFPKVGSSVFEYLVYYNELWINYRTGDVKTDFPEGIEWEGLEFEKKLSIRQLNENQILIHNTKSSHIDLNDEDVLVIIDSGYTKSGVYNINNKKWEIPPIYEQCDEYNGYLFCLRRNIIWADEEVNSPLDNNSYSYDIYKFSDLEWSVQHRYITNVNQISMSEVLNIDSSFTAPSGLNSRYDDTSRRDLYYLSENQWGILTPQLESSSTVFSLTESKDFIHNNPDVGYTFYIENDSVFFRYQNISLGVPANNSKLFLSFNSADAPYCNSFNLYSINGPDTTEIYKMNHQAGNENCYSEKINASILVKENTLVLEERYITEEYYYDLYGEGYSSTREIENSSIWKKTDNTWRKASPYYATIEKINKGYVVSTANFDGEPVFSEDGELLFDIETGYFKYNNAREKRYLILDENCKAISYLDWYDFEDIQDLGFGIRVKMEDAYFFVDYDCKAITNAEWDKFELENGKLKAIRYDQFLINEWGEEEIDENGEIIYLKKAKTQYFEL